ncbi:MAG: biotin/lipoate A/B protein ligase family protein [Peptococcaceae bacterium]|jgi:lipoate-protein ligase A|nr:biotin/lipoate A/B protein ligase family protein [Peptococcaceae bacterium]
MAGTGETWRLLDSGPGDGVRNMAVDEALLLEHAAGRTLPTLRFYRWDPPALSIGHFQPVRGEVNRDRLTQEGFGLVRRLTGGRAVLHRADLTYSVVVGEALLSGSVLETYRLLSAGLLAGLRLLGVEAELAGEKPGGGTDPACFAVPSSYELLAGGRKLVGSAQVRRKNTILQHGSLLLDFDPRLLARVTGPDEQAAALYRERVTSLREILGFIPPYGDLVGAFAQGFATALGVALVPGDLTGEEESLAARLAGKYGGDEWNVRC